MIKREVFLPMAAQHPQQGPAAELSSWPRTSSGICGAPNQWHRQLLSLLQDRCLQVASCQWHSTAEDPLLPVLPWDNQHSLVRRWSMDGSGWAATHTWEPLESPLGSEGGLSCQRGQMLTWIKWFTPITTKISMEERLMEALSACGNCQLRLGSLSTQRQQEAKLWQAQPLPSFVPLPGSCKMFLLGWDDLVKVIYLLPKSSPIRRVHRWSVPQDQWQQGNNDWFLFFYKLWWQVELLHASNLSPAYIHLLQKSPIFLFCLKKVIE